MSEKKGWFITGCSTGFGRELAKQLLENDYRVVVTARNAEKVNDLVKINPANALAINLDVTDIRLFRFNRRIGRCRGAGDVRGEFLGFSGNVAGGFAENAREKKRNNR
jgi:NAD(P)-dependent dehydrogenase (short-subunit alcohol dehydrogenase family)